MTIHEPQKHHYVNRPDIPFPPSPRPLTPAHVIKSDEEAIAVAKSVAEEFKKEAAMRDREGLLPVAELDLFSQSGLWGLTVPKAYGGSRVSYATLGEVIKILAAADPSLAQMPHNQLAFVEHIAIVGTEAQKQLFFGQVLSGIRFGNAMSEAGSRPVKEYQTKFTRDGDDWVVNGKKFYSTGALLGHVVVILGIDDDKQAYFAFVDRDAPGLTIINDWSSFGQRTTASGTVIIDNVRVPSTHVMIAQWKGDPPNPFGPINQLITAAIDAGIAKGTIEETIDFVRSKARPWNDANQSTASEDWFTVAAVGDLEIRLHAAEAILERAGRLIDIALQDTTDETVANASIATAEAKVLTTEVALQAANKLFELAGTRSTLMALNFDRHWRNARTHTLHDPVRWKYFHIGNYFLNGVKPARGAFI